MAEGWRGIVGLEQKTVSVSSFDFKTPSLASEFDYLSTFIHFGGMKNGFMLSTKILLKFGECNSSSVGCNQGAIIVPSHRSRYWML